MLPPVLTDPTPAGWATRHLLAHQARHDGPGPTGSWVRPDADLLARLHAGLVVQGATPPAAAKWLTSWFAGSLTDAVAFTLGLGAYGLVLDPAGLRWRLHPGGWVDRVDTSAARLLVPTGHPWAGSPDVEVTHPDDLRRRVVGALAAAAEPVVEACHHLAKVGRGSLWAEVADGVGHAVALQPRLPAEERVSETLTWLLAEPTAPWVRTPQVLVADTARGPAYVARRGGCCLVFRCEPPTADYCSTCSAHTLTESTARQVAWLSGA